MNRIAVCCGINVFLANPSWADWQRRDAVRLADPFRPFVGQWRSALEVVPDAARDAPAEPDPAKAAILIAHLSERQACFMCCPNRCHATLEIDCETLNHWQRHRCTSTLPARWLRDACKHLFRVRGSGRSRKAHRDKNRIAP